VIHVHLLASSGRLFEGGSSFSRSCIFFNGTDQPGEKGRFGGSRDKATPSWAEAAPHFTVPWSNRIPTHDVRSGSRVGSMGLKTKRILRANAPLVRLVSIKGIGGS
jgi:hypothetical protein